MFEPVTTAGIIVIGNEVLSGKVEEENARFLIGELRALGVDLQRIAVIKDDVEVIARDAREMSAAFDHVFTSGGVGGTHDDVTMEGLSRAFGVKLVRDQTLERLLREHYRGRVNDAVLRMAEVPEGAVLLGADVLPYPIVTVKNVYVLPGVPQFLRSKFEAIRPRLKHERPFVLRQIFVSVSEDVLADLMGRTQAALPGLQIGSYPRFDGADHKLRITIESRDPLLVERGTTILLEGIDPGAIVRVE